MPQVPRPTLGWQVLSREAGNMGFLVPGKVPWSSELLKLVLIKFVISRSKDEQVGGACGQD